MTPVLSSADALRAAGAKTAAAAATVGQVIDEGALEIARNAAGASEFGSGVREAVHEAAVEMRLAVTQAFEQVAAVIDEQVALLLRALETEPAPAPAWINRKLLSRATPTPQELHDKQLQDALGALYNITEWSYSNGDPDNEERLEQLSFVPAAVKQSLSWWLGGKVWFGPGVVPGLDDAAHLSGYAHAAGQVVRGMSLPAVTSRTSSQVSAKS